MLTTTLKKDYQDKAHEDVPCPLCSTRKDVVLATKGYPGIPVRNVICTGCGLIRINPRMTQKGYEDFYKEDFFEYLNPYGRPAYIDTIERTTDESFVTLAEKNILPYILPFVPEGGRILDIGSGFGQIPYLLQKRKKVTYVAIEPDPYSRQVAKEKIGIDLRDDTIENYLREEKAVFDFIYLDQVFEHLLTPLQTLKDLTRLLAPKGVIYIGVPNSYNPGVSMDRYYELAHTYGYTPSTMSSFASQAGLKVISLRDPFAPALEVLLTHTTAAYSAEDPSRLLFGAQWKDTYRRLKRKERLNLVRGFARNVLSSMFGPSGKERIRAFIDRLIRYRY